MKKSDRDNLFSANKNLQTEVTKLNDKLSFELSERQKLQAGNPKPLNPKPYTLNPKPDTLKGDVARLQSSLDAAREDNQRLQRPAVVKGKGKGPTWRLMGSYK